MMLAVNTDLCFTMVIYENIFIITKTVPMDDHFKVYISTSGS